MTQNNMEVVAGLAIKDLGQLDAKVKTLTELTLREQDEARRQKLFEDLLTASEERQRAQGWNEALTSAQAEIERLAKERDEARAEIERMTPNFVAYDYLESPAGRELAEARAEAAEKERDALREALNELLDAYSKPDAGLCCSGQDCGCMGATVRQLAEYGARKLLSALQPLEPKND